ncbi:MAG: 16S rRNA (cytidine(1402)-2'-O)-methyltransferase [Ruminococcus sp.]|nr:16S rRNA (cytidine(1402)-2'-O)-methyltransferase [Ruminococcus sp.]
MLYVVGTPIGNLEDITLRAVRILGEVDFIICEDTRVTLKLLNHLEIKKHLVAYQEHSHPRVSEKIIAKLESGENAAIVTDAGMPCISDPGEKIIRECYEKGIAVNVVPGPSAVVSALAISGRCVKSFQFEGFLSVSKSKRHKRLNKIRETESTLIFYEAPHKLVRTLTSLLEVLGNRNISLCHELTKIHESVERGTINDILEKYKAMKKIKGEFVIVVDGYSDEQCVNEDE